MSPALGNLSYIQEENNLLNKKQELIYAQRYLRIEVEEIVFTHENVLKCLSKVLCIFDYISFFFHKRKLYTENGFHVQYLPFPSFFALSISAVNFERILQHG